MLNCISGCFCVPILLVGFTFAHYYFTSFRIIIILLATNFITLWHSVSLFFPLPLSFSLPQPLCEFTSSYCAHYYRSVARGAKEGREGLLVRMNEPPPEPPLINTVLAVRSRNCNYARGERQPSLAKLRHSYSLTNLLQY